MVVNLVHDEVILETSPENASQVKEIIVRALSEAYQEFFPNAPLQGLIKPEIDQNCAEAKD